MTIREAAEVLYDEYTGTKGRLGNSTQEARWISFTEKVVRVAGQGVTDREALADHLASVRWDNAGTRMDRRQFWLQRADAFLAVLTTRTVAQVKAEALREAAAEVDWEWETFRAGDGMPSIRMHGKTPSELLNARADEIEREDKR